MPELIGGSLGYVIGLALIFLVLFWPIIILWLIYRITHDLRRIASALERREERQIAESASAPLRPLPNLEIPPAEWQPTTSRFRP